MKNAVPKNDKKKRKQLTEEIAKLEADLSQKHEEEIRQLKATPDRKVNEICIRILHYVTWLPYKMLSVSLKSPYILLHNRSCY